MYCETTTGHAAAKFFRMQQALPPRDLPPDLLARLPAPAAFAVRGSASALPQAPGAYLLLLRLDRAHRLDLATLSPAILPAGWYAYAGSARGPGGLRARLGRHFREEKPAHWHIDRLTPAAAALAGLAYPAEEECVLVSRLIGTGAFRAPLRGFGASDCRTCESHLLNWIPG